MSEKLYYDDFTVGEVFELGAHEVSAHELREFALQWDPQAFHIDRQAAAASMFGEPITSGWHTAAIMHRLHVDAVLRRMAVIVGKGVDELRWLVPVKAGDVLRGRATVTALVESASRPQGTVSELLELRNQRDEVVIRAVVHTLTAKRPEAVPER